MTVEEKLAALGLALPDPPQPVGNYRPAKRAGNLIFTSGQTARLNGVRRYVGKVGAGISEAEAYLSARDSTLNCLACVKGLIGDLALVDSIVKLTGYVNSVDGFTNQPAVINGASDLLEKLFGDAAPHARTAISVNALPSNVSVEVEMIVAVR